MTVKQRIAAVVAWVMGLKPVRVFLQYNAKGGPVLAAGLAFQAIFAVFAAVWVGFSIAGFAVTSSPRLSEAFLTLLATNVPGLIDTGNGGAIDADALLGTGVLTWTGAIAAIGLLITAVGWLAAGRDAVRLLFGLPTPPTNFLLLKLKDLALALAFGLAMFISAAVSVLSTGALNWVFDWAAIDKTSVVATVAANAVGPIIVLVLDALVLVAFYRVVSSIRIPWHQLWQGVLIAALALGVLQSLGSSLLGGATRNPLLASFAVIIGLLIWFNLISQIILIGATWIAVSADDADVDLSGRRRSGTSTPHRPSGVGTAL
ncbi:MAG: YihY/virulence factor BrkB family protein [Salinibacterium sp.]|nr:YihY/virulence factor BrkB family protein [Salinibacterium sp.]